MMAGDFGAQWQTCHCTPPSLLYQTVLSAVRHFPSLITSFTFKESSKSTRSAFFPTEMEPRSSKVPRRFAGWIVAQAMAVSSGMSICVTAVFTHSIRLEAEPAIAPSEARVAFLFVTLTSSPPSV